MQLTLSQSIKRLVFTIIIVTLASFSYAQEAINGNNSQISLLKVGDLAPINVLKDIEGKEQSYPIPEKWNIVFYWSLFCHSCIEEMPEIQDSLENLTQSKIETFFVSLDTEKMQKALKNFKKRRKFSQTILMEELANKRYLSADKWGVTMTPTVFIVNPQGKITFSHQGSIDLEELTKNLPSEPLSKINGETNE